MKRTQKILAVLLAVMVIVSSLPMAASADGEFKYPLVGLYSTSTKSEASLIEGDIDLTQSEADAATFYFITRDGYTFVEESLNYSHRFLTWSMSDDKTTMTFIVDIPQALQEDFIAFGMGINGDVTDGDATQNFSINLEVQLPDRHSGPSGPSNPGGSISDPIEEGKIYRESGPHAFSNTWYLDTASNGPVWDSLYIFEGDDENGYTRQEIDGSYEFEIRGGWAKKISFEDGTDNGMRVTRLHLYGVSVGTGYLVATKNGKTYTMNVEASQFDPHIQNPDTEKIYFFNSTETSFDVYNWNVTFQRLNIPLDSEEYGGLELNAPAMVVYEPDDNGDLVPVSLDSTFDYELEGIVGKVGYYEQDYTGYIEIQPDYVNSPPSGKMIATRNGRSYELEIYFEKAEPLVYSSPDGAQAHYLGTEVNMQADSNKNLTSVYLVQNNGEPDFATCETTGWQKDKYTATISADKRSIKIDFTGNEFHDGMFSLWVNYTLDEPNAATKQIVVNLYDQELWVVGDQYLGDKNVVMLFDKNFELLSDDYTVTVTDIETGAVLPTARLDDTYYMIDATKALANHTYAIKATKGSETYTYNTIFLPREYSIFSNVPKTNTDANGNGAVLEELYDYYVSTPGGTVTYTDKKRSFYIFVNLAQTEHFMPITEAQSDNAKIKVEPYFMYYSNYGGDANDGYACMKVTVQDGVDTAESAKITFKRKYYEYTAEGGTEDRFKTYTTVVNFAPEDDIDATFSQGTFAELLWKIITGIANEVKDRLEINGTGDVGAHSSEIRFDNIRNDVTDLELGDGVGDIGDGAFKGFDKLENVELPDTTTKIGAGAFEGCENLEEITIPGTVGEIDDDAFANTNSDFVIKGGKGDNYSETYAMKHNINYESTPDKSYRQGDMQMELDKVISCDNRVAVTAKIDNGTSNITGGYAIAAVYYQGQLIATQVIDNEMNKNSIERIVMQLPYLDNIDSTKLDVKIMYLNDDKQPAVKSAKKNGYNPSQPAACAVSATATEISSTANAPVQLTATDDTFSIDYTGVTSGDEYALMVVKAETVGSAATLGAISSENLLYIDQQTAASTTVSFSDFSLKDNANANVFVADKTGVKHIAYIGETAKTSVTVTVSASNITYGETVKPTATSSVSGAVYSYHYEGTGSTVYDSDEAPKAAGTYKVTATLVSKTHTGEGSANFTISAKNISNCTVEPIDSVTANGSAREPKITVKDGFTSLVKGKDFTVEYKNNINAGTATATITGIGNYSGTKTVNFGIEGSESNTKPSTPSGSEDETDDENTVTLPNGNTVMTEQTESNTTITVTTESGETVAKITLPSEPAESKEFTDVKENDWFAEKVAEAVGYGLFSGVTATTFAPNDGMTRGMLAQVLYNLSGKTEYGLNSGKFPDTNDWYKNAIDWAAAIGVVSGMPSGKFEPKSGITREQLATMLYRYAQAIGADNDKTADLTKFSDGAKVNDYAKTAMNWAIANGLITGRANGTLDPRGTATRAEVATVLVRFVEYLK